MKKNRIVQLLMLLLAVLIIGCNKSIVKQESKVFVTGNVKTVHPREIQLSNKPIPLGNDWSTIKDTSGYTTAIDTKGNFKFEIEIDEPNFYRLIVGDKTVELFLNPNDSISVKLDSIITIEGSNYRLNRYLLDQKAELAKSEGFIYRNLESLYALDESKFRNQLDSLKASNRKHYNTFKSSFESVPSKFEEQCVANIDYQYNYYKLLYPSGHEIVTRKKAELSTDYFDKIAEGLNKYQFLNNQKYISYLGKYVEILSAGDLKFRRYDLHPMEKIHSRYTTIKNLAVKQEIKDYLFEQHFNICNTNYSSKNWEVIFKEFEVGSKNKKLITEIKRVYQKSVDLRKQPDEIKIYKRVGDIELEAHVFYPKDHQKESHSSAYLYFHGGGWSFGRAEAGYDACKRMAAKGMVAISFEYRLIDVHGNVIQKSLEDAKSAIRWTRRQASSLGIDSNRIVATGFSAGAHLAASTAIIDNFVSEDNKDISSVPNLVITKSSSYDLTKGDGWFEGVSRGRALSISLLQNVKTNLPPFLSFHSTEDHLAPIYEFFQFKAAMESHKNDFQFQVFKGVGHFFRDKDAQEKMNSLTDEYLRSRGYLMDVKD